MRTDVGAPSPFADDAIEKSTSQLLSHRYNTLLISTVPLNYLR